MHRNSTGEVPSEILQAPIHGAGGRGWRQKLFLLQCTETNGIKSIHRTEVCRIMDVSPVTYAFPCKKASQISVRPFCGADLPWFRLHAGSDDSAAGSIPPFEKLAKCCSSKKGAVKKCKSFFHSPYFI
ncbi:hypothetical protein, partial [uncultured Dialister sp.]|uniref:hypothetical protein n=1 Tax=uncultured Dialister sp. TaxID=278064 RepID=UPI0026333C03